MPACSMRLLKSTGYAWVAVMALPGMTFANPHHSSFDDARLSTLDYARVVVERPVLQCAVSALSAPAGASVVSAVPIAARSGERGYCEIRGLISPEIQYIVYLPEAWNGRLYMHGNGGFAGEALDAPLGHRARMKAVQLGFAAAFTNTGHDAASAPDGHWAYDNLAKEADFGFRSVHLTADAVKQLLASYYGRAAARSYFDGCSTGGRQAFIAAQRFPQDFDGILAGAPVFDMSHMLWKHWQNQKAIAAAPLSAQNLKLLTAFLLERYDAADGLRDGVIGDPLGIDFKPERDLPRDSAGVRGFTDAQIAALSKIYGPVTIGDREVFPRTVVGSEAPGLAYSDQTLLPVAPQSAWMTRVVPDERGALGQRDVVESWFRYLAFSPDEPQLDWRTLDPARDLPRMQQARRLMDATDSDLGAFHRRGGKMIVYHGWADFGVSPLRTIQYYEEVAGRLGTTAQEFLRLYMVPGMFHCRGGVDVDRFDLMTPLVNWVESGVAPGSLTGARVENDKVVRTRPLCPYPSKPHFTGKGDSNRHESFACSAPSAATERR